MGTSNPLTPILESLFWTYTHIMCMYICINIHTLYADTRRVIPKTLALQVHELLHARTLMTQHVIPYK